MKRILFCAGILALAASCTQDDFESTSAAGEAQLKGISFETTLAEAPSTRGEYVYNEDTKQHNFFWYAESDRINIWSTNTTPDGKGSLSGVWDTSKYTTYKATQSASVGKFTGVDDNNIIDFQYDADYFNDSKIKEEVKQQNEGKFFAVYPEAAKVTSIQDGQFLIGSLPQLEGQASQTDEKGSAITQNLMMYSYTTARPVNSYDAVGEKINLSFNRPFTAMIFRTNGVDEYTDYFGKLTRIKFAMGGYDKDNDGSYEIAPSIINYGDAQYLVNTEDASKSKLVGNDGKEIEVDKTEAAKLYGNIWKNVDGEASYIRMPIGTPTQSGSTMGAAGNGIEWKDEYSAYMAINQVDRSAFRKEGVKENVEVTFNFEHITLKVYAASDANWPTNAGNFVTGPVLDINSYPYLLTEAINGNDRVLIVNSGDFNGIFSEDNEDAIAWNEGEINISEVGTIIANVQLTKEEKGRLKEFTNLKKITLAENTELEKGTFTQALEEIHFPKVQKIEAGTFGKANVQNSLKVVDLPAYDFTNDEVADEILHANVLEEINMSGAEGLNLGFPSTGFNLQGYTKLTKITVSDGFKLGPNSFEGCAALKEVKGAVALDAINSYNAFLGCVNLPTINLTGTIIPASAFEECQKLTKVLVNGKQIVPTSIGARAFYNCNILETMDLSKVEGKLGDEAFRSCDKFIGGKEGQKLVARVGAAEIGKAAFAECYALEHIDFINATKIGDEILNIYNGALKQVQFRQAIVINSGTYSALTFGNTTAKVQLFINANQNPATFNKNVLYLGSKKVPVTFNSIQSTQGI